MLERKSVPSWNHCSKGEHWSEQPKTSMSSGLGPIPATVLFAIGTGIVFLILGWILSMTPGSRLSREKHIKLRFFLTIPFTNPLAAFVLLCKRPMLGKRSVKR